MLVPFDTVVRAARGAGSEHAFCGDHSAWALLLEADPLRGMGEGEPDVESGFRPTLKFDRDKAGGRDVAPAARSWPNLWVAWLELRDSEQRSLSLGRGAGADVRVDHPTVSTLHLALMPSGAGWLVGDQGSSNGTTKNGEPLLCGAYVPLQSGDVLRLSEEVQATLLSPAALYRQAIAPGR